VKHIRSSLGDLRTLFVRTITVRDIAEPLVSFDSDHDAPSVRAFMEQRDFDVVGVRDCGIDTRRKLEQFVGELESLRNALAHANDIVKGRWPRMADLAVEAESILERLERV